MNRILMNGKSASREDVREAVFKARKIDPQLQVRATWEGGDFERLVEEAKSDGVTRIICGGGDGSINEVATVLIKYPEIEFAVLPLGTANDFARCCQIPLEPYEAIKLAIEGEATPIDTIKVNDRIVVNIATAGFGAYVTATTPKDLKNFLGGGAYTLVGMLNAINFKPYRGKVLINGQEIENDFIVGAICNGRQAGGGQVLASNALLNDGFIDIVMLRSFEMVNIPQVIQEINGKLTEGEYIKRFRTKKLEAYNTMDIPINLDGEPYASKNISVEVNPLSLKLILPTHDDLPTV